MFKVEEINAVFVLAVNVTRGFFCVSSTLGIPYFITKCLLEGEK